MEKDPEIVVITALLCILELIEVTQGDGGTEQNVLLTRRQALLVATSILKMLGEKDG